MGLVHRLRPLFEERGRDQAPGEREDALPLLNPLSYPSPQAPIPTNHWLSNWCLINQGEGVAHHPPLPWPCTMTIAAYGVCPAGHQVLPILPPASLLHVPPPLPLYYLTVPWLGFLPLASLPSNPSSLFLPEQCPEAGFSLPQRKTLTPVWRHACPLHLLAEVPPNRLTSHHFRTQNLGSCHTKEVMAPIRDQVFSLPCLVHALPSLWKVLPLLRPFCWCETLPSKPPSMSSALWGFSELPSALRHRHLFYPVCLCQTLYVPWAPILQCSTGFLYPAVYSPWNWGILKMETVS